MKMQVKTVVLTFGLATWGLAHPVLAADEAAMMAYCNTYAAERLHVSTSDIASLKYEGQRTDGTHAVNGNTTSGQTFQCSFNRAGTDVVNWAQSGATASAPAVGSASDLSSFQGARAGQSEGGIRALGYEAIRTEGLTTWWFNRSTGACARITTADGRYSDVTMLPAGDC